MPTLRIEDADGNITEERELRVGPHDTLIARTPMGMRDEEIHRVLGALVAGMTSQAAIVIPDYVELHVLRVGRKGGMKRGHSFVHRLKAPWVNI